MLTRSGLGAIVTALVVAGLGLWWNYEELVVLAVGIGLVVLLAVVIASRRLRATVERHVLSVRVARGDPVRLSYRLVNNTTYRSGRATLIDRCDDEVVRTPMNPLGSGDVEDVTAHIATHRRGIFEVGPLDIERIDPFMLAVGRWRNPDGRMNLVTVHPKVYELVGPQGSSRVVENESIIRRAATDPMSGFVSMRDYVAGDDPRLIHWPTTARTGTLMVREHVEVRRPEFTIVVDAAPGASTDVDFEEIVDVAATLAVHALRSGLDVVVRTTSAVHPGSAAPLHSEAEVLDLLTPVRRSTDDEPIDFLTLFAHGFDHTSVLLLTGPAGPSTQASTVDHVTTICIGEGARAAGTVSLAAQDAPDFVSRWRRWS